MRRSFDAGRRCLRRYDARSADRKEATASLVCEARIASASAKGESGETVGRVVSGRRRKWQWGSKSGAGLESARGASDLCRYFGGEPGRRHAATAVCSHVDHQVLPSIPSAWPLKLLSPFLSGALRRSTHARHEAALLKAVSVSQNLAISEPLSELQMSLGPTIEREDLDKGEKRRRPEVVQVLRKEGKEEKGLPVDDVELVLR